MDMHTVLQLGLFDQNISVMRLLPPEIAFRYHAVPIATDGRNVTVAVAASEDQEALLTIQEAIDAPVCFIQADPLEIDLQLNQVWAAAAPSLRLLAWVTGQEPESFAEYASALAGLLKADLEFARIPSGGTVLQELMTAVESAEPDLLLYSSCCPARTISRLVGILTAADRDVSYLKVPPEPVWPLSRILLVLPGLKGGVEGALAWVSKLAGTGSVRVTVLPVLPPLPLCYGCFLEHTLEEILTGTDPVGQKLQDISRHFQEKRIMGVYKLRDGDPISQIREEVFASDPDLIILPAHLRKGLNTWISEDPGALLLKSSSKSILITYHKE